MRVEKTSDGYSEYFNGDVKDVLVAFGKEGAFDKITSLTRIPVQDFGCPTGQWELVDATEGRVVLDAKYDAVLDNVEGYLNKLYSAKEYPTGPLKTDNGVLITYNTVSHCQYFFKIVDGDVDSAMFNGQIVKLRERHPFYNLKRYHVNSNIECVNEVASFKDLVYLNKADEEPVLHYDVVTTDISFYNQYMCLIENLRSFRPVKDFHQLVQSNIPTKIQTIKNEARALREAGTKIQDIKPVRLENDMIMLFSEIDKIEAHFMTMFSEIMLKGETRHVFPNVTLQAYTDVASGKVNVYTIPDTPVIISAEHYTNQELIVDQIVDQIVA